MLNQVIEEDYATLSPKTLLGNINTGGCWCPCMLTDLLLIELVHISFTKRSPWTVQRLRQACSKVSVSHIRQAHGPAPRISPSRCADSDVRPEADSERT